MKEDTTNRLIRKYNSWIDEIDESIKHHKEEIEKCRLQRCELVRLVNELHEV